MMIAQLAEPVSMSVPLKRFPKVISTKLILKFAPIAALALMFAPLRPFIRNNEECVKKEEGGPKGRPLLFWHQNVKAAINL
jgi:hypothetical protein